MKKSIIFCLLSTFFILLKAQNTETIYLSGTGLNDEKIWKFYCSDGMNSKKWSKIKVPAQWEVQGFGEYTYGRWYKAGMKNPSMEFGLYEYSFKVPAAWKGKVVRIVFILSRLVRCQASHNCWARKRRASFSRTISRRLESGIPAALKTTSAKLTI